MSSSIKHLVVIIDLNPIYWSDKVSSSTTLNLKQYLNIIIQFCNAYIAFDINHRLTIIGCSNNETSFLYPDPTNESSIIPTVTKTNMFEQLFVVDRVVENNLKGFIDNSSPISTSSGSMITMALTQALCYINRLIRETLAGEKHSFRILIIQTTNDTSKQYMNFMNAVFTSEKINVPIDGCILNNDSSLLQQACKLNKQNFRILDLLFFVVVLR
jgi:transcription initiation factor TFIIH subunit 3